MKMAVLLSGSGRTLDNFNERIANRTMQGTIEVVISNVESALGLEKARKYGYPAFHAGKNEEINGILAPFDCELILLAGFLKLYKPPSHLARSVLNIHPSLIPMFAGEGYYGMWVHRAVHARGLKISGCTVHFADQMYDEGPIVVQKCVALPDGATPDEIASLVFEAECEAYPEAVNLVHRKGINAFWPEETASGGLQ